MHEDWGRSARLGDVMPRGGVKLPTIKLGFIPLPGDGFDQAVDNELGRAAADALGSAATP